MGVPRNSYSRLARSGFVLGLALCLAVSAEARQSTSTARKPSKPPSASSQQKKPPSAASQKRTRRYSAAAARARRARLARAREAAALAVPRFKVDDQGDLVPDVRAEAAIIYDPVTDHVLWEDHSQDQRSIASITKVMTAVCFLETDPDLSQDVLIDRADVRAASTTHLRASERVSVDNLLHLLLIASDNGAARALARVSPYGSDEFVARMNQKARDLGLESTSYSDPSGLDPKNVSSAYDMARLISYAAEDEFISSLMRTKEYSLRTSRRLLTIHNTNQLVRTGSVEVRGGKTGFISKAGYCLATLLRLPELDRSVAVVVLGARSNAGRFMETRHLLDWITAKTRALLAAKQQQQDHHLPD